MLRVLYRVIQRAPLLILILFIWFVLTVLSLIGRFGPYRGYSTEHGRLPGLSIVMRGIHDHVYPWSKDYKSGPADGAKETAKGTAAQEGSASDKADQKDEDIRDAETGQGEKEAGSGRKEQDTSQVTAETAGDPMAIPDTSCSKVVGAKDYGVADDRYLSSDDTVYNTDKEGLFAPNGTYYSLQEVDDSYFADALMIGDSRTVGLYEYGDMADVTNFMARESASIYDLFDEDEKLDYTPRGKESKEQTLKGLLKKTEFKKIYISVGVNELGVPDTKDYYEEFRKVVEKINKLQPDAIIYIQGIMHVSKNMSSTDPVYNNKAIVQRNRAISTLANGRNIFYIDMNGDLCDENGDLKAELTGDGIHLKASACELWHTFLRKNAVVVSSLSGVPLEQDSAEKTPSGEDRSEHAQEDQDQPDQEPAGQD